MTEPSKLAMQIWRDAKLAAFERETAFPSDNAAAACVIDGYLPKVGEPDIERAAEAIIAAGYNPATARHIAAIALSAMPDPSGLVITQADYDAASEWAKDQTHWNMLARAFAMHRLSAMPDPLAMAEMRAQGQAEGFAAAISWLRERGAMKPPASLWCAAATLADQMEHSRIPMSAIDPATLEVKPARTCHHGSTGACSACGDDG